MVLYIFIFLHCYIHRSAITTYGETLSSLLYRFCQDSSGPSGHHSTRHLGVCCGVWHEGIGSRLCGYCWWRGWAFVNQACLFSASLDGIGIWEVWKLGWQSWAFCLPGVFLSSQHWLFLLCCAALAFLKDLDLDCNTA